MRTPTLVMPEPELRSRSTRKRTAQVLACLFLGGLIGAGGKEEAANSPEEKAAAAVEKLGGTVFRSGTLPDQPVIEIDLDDTQATDDDLAHLEHFPHLQGLTLEETRITDAGLAHIEKLTNLTDLCLDETAVGDAGLTHVKRLVNLRKLSLDHMQSPT